LGIINTEEFDYLQTKNGKDVTTVTDKGYILIGTGKSSKYHFGVYEDLQSRFTEHLRSTNHMIISGYGWNDYAINKKLVAWLQNNRNNKIMLIHKYPDQMVEKSRYLPNNFLDRYSDQIEKENHWFGEISSVDIIGFLL
jgi:hypothetical protein